MCGFSFIYLYNLTQETPKHMKKESVNRTRSFKEPVPKSAQIASNIQGQYFLLPSRDFHKDALGHIA